MFSVFSVWALEAPFLGCIKITISEDTLNQRELSTDQRDCSDITSNYLISELTIWNTGQWYDGNQAKYSNWCITVLQTNVLVQGMPSPE